MPARSDLFIEHLADAVRIPTVSYDEHPVDTIRIQEFHSFLEKTYSATWTTLDVETINEHALLLTWEGACPDEPGLLLIAHLDVVPAEGDGTWTYGPFDADRDLTHLYGRGVLDDKGPLIAILEVVEALIEDGFRPQRTIGLAFGHDEERMGTEGARAIAERLLERKQRFALALDEGGSVTEGIVPGANQAVAVVAVGEKGYADLELIAHGEGGHSSTPPRQNAIGRLSAAVASVESHGMPAQLQVAVDFFEAIQPALGTVGGPVIAALSKLKPAAARAMALRPATNALARTTVTPTMIGGGTKANVLPSSAKAVLNARIMPGDTVSDVIAHVQRHAGEGIAVNLLAGHDPPPLADPLSLPFGMVRSTIEDVFPDAVVAPYVTMVATDARFYVGVAEQVLRFQPFRMTAGEFAGIHGADERMRLADAAPALQFYERLIRRVCGRSLR